MNDGSINKVLLDQLTGGKVEYPRMEEAFDVVSKVSIYQDTDDERDCGSDSGGDDYYDCGGDYDDDNEK